MVYSKIKGENVCLGPINLNDSEKYALWLNDLETATYLNAYTREITTESTREYLSTGVSRGDQLFEIRINARSELIGNCGFKNIDQINRRAEIGIFIGKKDYWGKGYGYETVMLLLDYGFQVLNLNSIYLHVYTFNPRAIRCYEKCGFTRNGCLREARIINGKKIDQIYMDILASEFPGYSLKKQINQLIDMG